MKKKKYIQKRNVVKKRARIAFLTMVFIEEKTLYIRGARSLESELCRYNCATVEDLRQKLESENITLIYHEN